jgi:lysyl-tRNA synthetase, class II
MPYPNSFARTHIAGRLQRDYGETPAEELERLQRVVAVGGRLMYKSALGSASLGIVEDQSGRMDVMVSDEAAGKTNRFAYEAWNVGDIVGVAGMLCRLPGGGLAVRAHEMELLVKALRPLPAQGAGPGYLALLSDPRKRAVFQTRSRVIAAIRAYLGGTTYVEVETPLLQQEAVAGVVQFATYHNALGCRLHLRASGDAFLKRLLIGGVERVYEINRYFSSEAPAPDYFPEGTVLEMYCAYSSYLYMMALLEQLAARAAQAALGSTDVSWRGQTLHMGQPFARMAAKDARAAELLQPTYVLDFAAEEAPRVRRKDGAPEVAEQFQLFLGGHKVAEGRSELNDADETKANYDSQFARAVEYGMPPASGLTLWLDRFIMVLTDSASLRDVVLFPAHADR